jgi:hypothetical protein
MVKKILTALSLRGFSRSNPVINKLNYDWITSSTSCLAMTAAIALVVGLVSFASNPVKAGYTDSVSSDLNLSVNPVVSLSISNCDTTNNPNPETVTLSIEPSSTGTFGSTCQNINVAANTPGYSLSIKSSSTDLLYQNPTSITPAPIVASTDKLIDSPATLPNDSWGFAIEDQLNFSTTYTTNDADNTYAKLLTTDQTIYQTDKALGEDPAPLSSFTAYYGAKLTLATIAGEYKTTITYTAIGEEIPEPVYTACVNGPLFKGNIGDIRDAATTTGDWVVGNTGIANDTRGDGQEYCISKLADENVWMLNNLKLGSFNEDILLTPVDTNVTASWTLPKIGNAIEGIYEMPRLYAFVDGQSGFSSSIPNSKETDINSQNFAGYYYNWCAATAGMISTTCRLNNITMPTVATQDICPANWRIPTGGNSGEFDALSSAMAVANDNSPYENFQFTKPFRGVIAGRHVGNSPGWNYQGLAGYIWSASHKLDSYTAAYGLFLSDSNINTGWNIVDSDGLSVRCLLR